MFNISDKVVCVDDSPGRGDNRFYGKPLPLCRDAVYALRGLGSSRCGTTVCYLVGIYMGANSRGEEFGFAADRFRKISDVKAVSALVATTEVHIDA